MKITAYQNPSLWEIKVFFNSFIKKPLYVNKPKKSIDSRMSMLDLFKS